MYDYLREEIRLYFQQWKWSPGLQVMGNTCFGCRNCVCQVPIADAQDKCYDVIYTCSSMRKWCTSLHWWSVYL